MLPRLPVATNTVLKRIQALPLDYWQHVGDPLADLLSTIYPLDDAATLLSLVQYEADQGQPLCLQFLAQRDIQPARWHDARLAADLRAWQTFVQQFPLAVRLAWQTGASLRLLSQRRWAAVWPDTLTVLQRFMQHLDDALLAPALPAPDAILLLRLELAILRRNAEDHGLLTSQLGVPLAQTDLAALIVCLSEELMRALQGLGLSLDSRQQQGLRHWAVGLGQALAIEPVWLAGNEDEARALRQVLLQEPSALAAPLVQKWLQAVAAADALPAAERRTLALARSLLDPLVADTLGLPRDRIGSLWRKAGSWVIEKGLPLAGQADAIRNLQKKAMGRWS